jgi:hypothetical protein
MDWVEDENGNIVWRDDVTKDNYQKEGILAKGEIYRGITYARAKEWNNSKYNGTVVEVYRPDGSGLDYYTPNENGMYRFPESGRGFDRYSTNANNENYSVNGATYHGDNYASAETFAGFYNTVQEFYEKTGYTTYYGDISAYNPKINLGHSTHYSGGSVDIHYFGSKGQEVFSYLNASKSILENFISVAYRNGFTNNYTYGLGNIWGVKNPNQSLHKDHFHIGYKNSEIFVRKGIPYGQIAK